MLRGLQSLYVCKGFLALQTPLHIGGGDTVIGTTDSPVMRTTEGQPFIPGPSLKGSFRSTVEKLALTLELPHMDKDVLDTNSTWIKTFNNRRVEEGWSDEEVVKQVEAEWPATALLFGNPYTASKIFFADAYLQSASFTTIQRRDGVAIDRDSECAMDGLKYDYEVVIPTLRFHFELRIENPTHTELALACLGLSELFSGFFSLGGKRSSGMGRCSLVEPHIYMLDLTQDNDKSRVQQLQRYLIGKTLEEKLNLVPDLNTFIDRHIQTFLKEGPEC